MKQQNRMMVESAYAIAKKTHSQGVLLYGDMIEDYDTLAILVSEETGGVGIFHHAKIFMEIKKGE